ncbi:MAG: sulfotransferase domain-containing protein, partial [Crocosphaera sp.]
MEIQEKQLLCFFGHHKCGTQWIQGILREVCQDMGLIYSHAYSAEKFNDDLEEFIKQKKCDIFSYTNAKCQYVEKLKNFRGFHVIRDPRDIVVSAYFSHLYSHPVEQSIRLKEERETLQKMSKHEGLIQEIEFNQGTLEAIGDWNYHQENVMEIKMEDLTINSYAIFVDIFRFLGIVSSSRPTFKERWDYLLALSSRQVQQKMLGKTVFDVHLQKIPYERALG